MMVLLQQWLLGITGASLLVALADSCMPRGPVKQVGKLVCGLILMLMLVKPFLQLSPESLALMGDSWHGQLDAQSSKMEEYYNNQIKSIIEQRLATYIVDKAKEEGLSCYPVVICALGEDGIFIPISVTLSEVSSENAHFLTSMICQDFGIAQTQITVQHKEVEHEQIEISPNF